MNRFFVFSLFLFSIVYQEGIAQDTSKYLGLKDAISAATASNDAVRIALINEQLAKAKFKQTDAIFLPQVNFSYTAFSTNNPLNAFGFKLQQKNISATDFNPDLLNHPGATADFTTKIEVQQPLLNADLLYQRKGAALQVEMYQLMTKRTKEALAFETEKAYLQLQMLYSAATVLNEALETTKALYKNATDYFNQGLIQKSDVLNADVQRINIETQLKNTRSNIEDASDMLSLIMGSTPGTVYTVDSIIQNSNNTGTQLSADRADFKAMQKGMDGYQMMIASSRMSYLPRLNAFASWQLNDKAMLGFNANAYLAGIQLSWNIFNGNRTKNIITEQKLEKEKLSRELTKQKSESQLAINHTQRQLSDADFAIRQQQYAIEQAAEALRVLENRYQQGLVKTTDVLLAQTQLSQQKLSAVQAIFNYNVAAAYLQFLTTGK